LYGADREGTARVPVLVGGMTDGDRDEASRDEAAKQQRCPSCGRRDAIRFLGSRPEAATPVAERDSAV
jgi:hypothetical protein